MYTVGIEQYHDKNSPYSVLNGLYYICVYESNENDDFYVNEDIDKIINESFEDIVINNNGCIDELDYFFQTKTDATKVKRIIEKLIKTNGGL